MNIEIGTKYLMNGREIETLIYNKEKEVLLVKETDGNLVFVLGNFNLKDDNVIVSTNRVSYTITELEIFQHINSQLADDMIKVGVTAETIAKAIRTKYYQIPTYLAEVVAEWYMKQ